MNSKKAGRLYFSIVLVHLAVVVLMMFIPLPFLSNMAYNFLFSEMIIWVPAAIFLTMTRTNPVKLCRMRKVHLSTMFMTVLFAFLCSPLITFVNGVSMLFVDNTVLAISKDVVATPFWLMFLIIAVYGPFCEEFVFRGVLFQSYKKQGNPLLAFLISSLLFGLMHMNFNQASYAFVVGIMLALLMEATDSFWPVFLMHGLINGVNVAGMYLTSKLPGDVMEQAYEMASGGRKGDMLLAVSAYLLLAVIFTPLAGCVLSWIARREERTEHVRYIWHGRKNSCKGYFTPALVIAAVLVFVYMIAGVIKS